MIIDNNSNLGIVNISKDAISKIVHKSVMESYGFIGFGYKERDILEILKGENITKGVNISENEDGSIDIEIYVVVQYGVNIETVANNSIEKIRYDIKNITSLNVNKITVNVQGVKVK